MPSSGHWMASLMGDAIFDSFWDDAKKDPEQIRIASLHLIAKIQQSTNKGCQPLAVGGRSVIYRSIIISVQLMPFLNNFQNSM